jgi:hypothetical protein
MKTEGNDDYIKICHLFRQCTPDLRSTPEYGVGVTAQRLQ